MKKLNGTAPETIYSQRRLDAAIMLTAVEDLRGWDGDPKFAFHKSKQKVHTFSNFQSAVLWAFTDEYQEWCFSMGAICGRLGLATDKMRKALWKKLNRAQAIRAEQILAA